MEAGAPRPAPKAHRILVTGYPNYTQPHDLLKVFKKFGNVHIDKCNNWSATLSYPTEQEAALAIEQNKKAHIYGYYLGIKVYTSKEKNAIEEQGRQQAMSKREFPRSKEKSIIIAPKQIDLSGDFHMQLDNILAAIRLTQDDVKALSVLYTDIEGALQTIWPGCRAIPFGSITSGLGIKTSDADCFISIPVTQDTRHNHATQHTQHVSRARRVLSQYPRTFTELLAIPRANTPLVKLFHVPTATACDVTFKTPLGTHNSYLLACLLPADPRMLPLAVLLKYWAKVHDLSGTGKLTNYALTLLVVFYLQQRKLLPPVHKLQDREVMVDYWNTGFNPNLDLRPAVPDSSSIAELLGGFFQYYAKFNFEELVVCPFLGTPVKKEVFKDLTQLPAEFELYKKNVLNHYVMPLRYETSICIQDPFEQCHNVASSIFYKLAVNIKAFFQFGADAYEKEKNNNCQEFLRIILLQKPKLIQGKTHPEYRVNLYPRIINNIISSDWKPVVRDVIMKMFENMLKIKLSKLEETSNPESKKEKEKYLGILTKSIWKKRKQFERLYSNKHDMSFEEKQAKITEEVISVDKQTLNTNFQLTLTFSPEPKSAVAAVKLVTGDFEQFIDFGKFFISVIQMWAIELLKPFSNSVPNSKDTTTKKAETRDKDNNQKVKPEAVDELVELVVTHNIVDNQLVTTPSSTQSQKVTEVSQETDSGAISIQDK